MTMTASPSTYEQLLRKGPQNGDVVAALDELRYKIVADGIPSNGDGMVNNPLHTPTRLFLTRATTSPNYEYTSGSFFSIRRP